MKQPFIYTVIGDSLSCGTGAPKGKGFSDAVQDGLLRMYPSVVRHNHGIVGATTLETFQHVVKNETVRNHVAEADVITVTAGGNDLIQAATRMYIEGTARSMKPPMKLFAEAYIQLVAELRNVNRTEERDSLIILLDSYNPFPKVRDAVLWVNFVNRCIHRVASMYKGGIAVARIYEAFLGGEAALISNDTIHPNEAGYEVMARAVQQILIDRY